MPNRKPRIAITLPDDLHRSICQIASSSGEPASRVCADILVEAAPVLHRIAATLRQVAEANAAARTELKARLAPLAAEAETAAAAALSLLDRLSEATAPAAPAGARSAPQGARRGSADAPPTPTC